MTISKNGSYNFFERFSAVYGFLDYRYRVGIFCLFGILSVGALVELGMAGGLAFFVSVLTDPGVIQRHELLVNLVRHIPFGLGESERGVIVFLAAGVAFLFLVKNAFGLFIAYWQARFGGVVEAFLGKSMLSGFMGMPFQWILGTNSADMILLLNFPRTIGNTFVPQCLCIVGDILLMFTLVGGVFIVHPSLALSVFFALSVLAVIIFRQTRNRVDVLAQAVLDLRIDIGRNLLKSVHGYKDVRLAGASSSLVMENYAMGVSKALLMGKQSLWVRLPSALIEVLGISGLMTVVGVMLYTSGYSRATVMGTLALLAVAAWRILPAISRVLSGLATLRTVAPDVDYALAHLVLFREKAQRLFQTAEPIPFQDGLELKEVGFTYETGSRPVLSGLDFRIGVGETLGIVGRSGGGKSTLVNLLIGLLHPVEGSIDIDGKPFVAEDGPGWMQTVGYVPQSSYICDGSLAENIAFGCPPDQVSMDRVHECCRLAALDFVDDLAEGVHTRIGERGVLLSGGQAQRVAIARALYRDPAMLIFDEATSSLDTASEKAIQRTIYSFKGERTLVIIAHRLSTVEDCDKVIWLDEGKIRMAGAAAEVLAVYRRAQEHGDPETSN